ncbi:MAG: hypothetical protein AB7N80_10305 [Bdellovibrionales bacterium]
MSLLISLVLLGALANGQTRPGDESPVPREEPSLIWTDDQIEAQSTVIKAVHLNEIRDAINQKRTSCGLQPVSWQEPIVAGVTPIKKDHIDELRQALTSIPEVQRAMQNNRFTDEQIVRHVTVIRASHIMELRRTRPHRATGVLLDWRVR